MKRPSAGSQKKVTAENLVRLGAERLAEILASVAETRVDLKRRLRVELAAQQGLGPLIAEIDKRLSAFETRPGKISWAKGRPSSATSTRCGTSSRRAWRLDAAAAMERLWRFLDTALQSSRPCRDRHGELAGVFERAAADPGALLMRPRADPLRRRLSTA